MPTELSIVEKSPKVFGYQVFYSLGACLEIFRATVDAKLEFLTRVRNKRLCEVLPRLTILSVLFFAFSPASSRSSSLYVSCAQIKEWFCRSGSYSSLSCRWYWKYYYLQYFSWGANLIDSLSIAHSVTVSYTTLNSVHWYQLKFLSVQ